METHINKVDDVLNNNYQIKEIPFEKDHFKNLLIREINFNDLYQRLYGAKQDKIKIKEVILESEIDFIKSVKQLKSLFDTELENMTQKMNDIFNQELLKVKTLYHQSIIGNYLLQLIELLKNEQMSLIIKDGTIWLYKFYNPTFEVCEGYTQDDSEICYDESICELKGIYLNLLHPKITNGSIMITSKMHHPNVRNEGFSEACPGTLSNREIPIDKPAELISFMKEICKVYEKVHLGSAYYTPSISYSKKENSQTWTT